MDHPRFFKSHAITVISGSADFSRKAQKGAFFVLLHRKDFIEKIVSHVIDIAGSVGNTKVVVLEKGDNALIL